MSEILSAGIISASGQSEDPLALEAQRPEHPLRLERLRFHDGATVAVAQRIIERTQKSGECLIWTRGKEKDGYGVTYYSGKQWRVHRFVYYAWIGDVLPDLFVLHRCDNPPCCLPHHLFPGDASINAQDAASKGRMGVLRGELFYNSKLTLEDVKYILDNYRWRTPGRMAVDLARRFNVSVGAVWGVLYERTWRRSLVERNHPDEKL